MEYETVISLVADIISAHVSNNSVAVGDVPTLIGLVYGALVNAGKSPEAAPSKREPAVPIRSSVKPDSIACLECGQRMKVLKRHLTTEHSLTPGQYRERWSLGIEYPLVATAYAEKRREIAKEHGLGRKASVQAGRKKSVALA